MPLGFPEKAAVIRTESKYSRDRHPCLIYRERR